MKYDWREMRDFAFVILGDKIYEAYEHYECLIDILCELGCKINDVSDWTDNEMIEEIENKYASNLLFGEICHIDGNEYVLTYEYDNINKISVFFNRYGIILLDNIDCVEKYYKCKCGQFNKIIEGIAYCEVCNKDYIVE
jgi:hypothetical protein